MKKPKFERIEHQEDNVEYFVNGISVGSSTHDDLGWHGMQVVNDLFDRIANAINVEVEEREA